MRVSLRDGVQKEHLPGKSGYCQLLWVQSIARWVSQGSISLVSTRQFNTSMERIKNTCPPKFHSYYVRKHHKALEAQSETSFYGNDPREKHLAFSDSRALDKKSTRSMSSLGPLTCVDKGIIHRMSPGCRQTGLNKCKVNSATTMNHIHIPFDPLK
jgi:hypothetical protein